MTKSYYERRREARGDKTLWDIIKENKRKKKTEEEQRIIKIMKKAIKGVKV